jgi:hypothetical protein
LKTASNDATSCVHLGDFIYYAPLSEFDPDNKEVTGARIPRDSRFSLNANQGNEPLGSISRQSQQGQRKLH